MTNDSGRTSGRVQVDLAEVMCDVTIHRKLFGAKSHTPVIDETFSMGTVRASATYVHKDATGSVDVRPIGHITCSVVDLIREDGSVVDPIVLQGVHQMADWIVDELFTEPTILQLNPDALWPDRVGRLIVVNDINIRKEFRGQKLGPRLLTTLVDAVKELDYDGGMLVAVLTEPNTYELDGADPTSAQEKIAAGFRSAGYRPFRNGIFWHHSAFLVPEQLNA